MQSWLLAVVFFPLSLFAANIEGTYEIRGTDPYEKNTYSGTATIKADQNGVYQIVWSFSDGEKFQGTGLGTGLTNGNEFSAVFNDTNPEKTNHIGLQTYTLKGNNLEGSWVLLNQNLVGQETLIKK